MANYFNSKHCFPNYNKTTYTLKWPTLSECDVGDGESLWVVFVEKWSQYCEWAVNDQCIRGLGIESIHWLRCGGCPFTYLPSHPCPISVNLVQKIKCVPIFKVTLPYSWLPHIEVFFFIVIRCFNIEQDQNYTISSTDLQEATSQKMFSLYFSPLIFKSNLIILYESGSI